MKKFKNILLLVSMLLVNTAYAQRVQNIEDWMNSLISKAIDNNVEVTKSLGRERDIQKEGTPLKWRCDIYQFTLTKKQRPLLDEMIKAFEANGNDNPNCYGINTLTTINPQNEGKRNLMIGDDPKRYITIGQDYNNYINVNILDTMDTTKTHRYAYALEWREQSGTSERGSLDVRYIITYAKIPSAFTSYKATIKYPSLPDEITSFIKERSRKPKGNSQQAPDKAQAWFLGQDKPVSIEHKLSLSNGDTVFVVTSKTNGENGVWLPNNPTEAVNDMLCNENVLLMFSDLKQYYNKYQNTELTAISIYTLCKHANESGFFTDPRSFEELEHLMYEMDVLIEKAKTETDRKYFQMAREQLDKILKSRK
ncbi:MAG: hypothetical protein K6E45_05675 [Bacteroidaceae bacterium]|nr:hypothetical protein [Bacteroidaceae bacterium]